MRYRDTFIMVATDCPAATGETPVARGETKTIPCWQYELLSRHPYKFTQDELYFEVHVRHKGISGAEAKRNREALWQGLFSKPQPCLRVSMLAKRYGWGIHYDQDGKIAIYAVDSKEYAQFTRKQVDGPKLVYAVRGKRA